MAHWLLYNGHVAPNKDFKVDSYNFLSHLKGSDSECGFMAHWHFYNGHIALSIILITEAATNVTTKH